MRTKQWSPHIDWRAARLGVPHTINRNSAGLYKIEQPVRLCVRKVPSGMARQDDIGRKAGLGRAVSFASPFSST